ncbi:MAG: Protein tilB [Marteilia pararefringens]
MVRISLELIRKRSEHNDSEYSNLEELSLHQEKIERIENLDKWCKKLQILLLQGNFIPRIENLSRLKDLKYLNLALNCIEKLENIESLESLEKLDLTANFIHEISNCRSILWKLSNLKEIYLTGNACTNIRNYRLFVIKEVNHIEILDGIRITKKERIFANSLKPEDFVRFKADEYYQLQEYQSKKEQYRNDPRNAWINCPESRISDLVQNDETENKNESSEEKVGKEKNKERKLRGKDGNLMNINEANLCYNIRDMDNQLVFTIFVPKYLDTSDINITLESKGLRMTIRKKLFQLRLLEEISLDEEHLEIIRGQGSGRLQIKVKKLAHFKTHAIEMNCESKGNEYIEFESSLDDKKGNILSELDIPALI